MPARALNRVVLPVLGLPTRATVRGGEATAGEPSRLSIAGSLRQGDGNACRFPAAQAEAIVAEANVHRITQRREPDHLDLFPLEQAHLQEALHKGIIALDGFDP